jgi:hypothetical protein
MAVLAALAIPECTFNYRTLSDPSRIFGQRRIENCALLKLFTFGQFSAWLSSTVSANPPALPALEEVMENFAQLMQRLLELQSDGRQRSPELVAEDKRLMDRLQKRTLAGKPPQAVSLSENVSEGARFTS